MADKLPEIRPTPVKVPALAALANAIRSVDEFARKPFGYDNPPLQIISDLVGVPERYRTLENIAYGSPLTRGTGQARVMTPDTAGSVDVLFGAPAAGRLAVKAGKAAAPYAARQAVNLAEKYGVAPTMNVIKPKGGSWYEPSIDRTIEPLKLRVDPELEGYARRGQNLMPHEAEDVLPKIAINDWLQTKLRNYIKNELGTPEDPVRALAERGVLHYDPTELYRPAELALKRTRHGQLAGGMGESEFARAYEALSDYSITGDRASDWLEQASGIALEKMPWIRKVPPDTLIYHKTNSGMNEALGFNHLVDEMRNAMAIGTDIPPNLRIDPKKLEKMTVPQIVERVSQINAWRAKQKAAADLARANNAATVLHKEYPEQGYKWVELRKPESEEAGSALEQALKYEGEVMGHCVGGYCPDVAEGRSRIYSLRDKKGEPHVTIEVNPDKGDPVAEVFRNLPVEEQRRIHREALGDDSGLGKFKTSEEAEANARRVKEFMLRERPELADLRPTERITQIKGKQNRMPKEEYLPFVQDFVRGGKWSDIRDNRNAGLRRLSDVFNDAETEKIRQLGGVLPQHGWLTGEDIQQLHNLITPEGKRFKYDAKGNIIDDGQNYAEGGLVQAYNPEEVDAIAKQFEEAMNG